FCPPHGEFLDGRCLDCGYPWDDTPAPAQDLGESVDSPAQLDSASLQSSKVTAWAAEVMRDHRWWSARLDTETGRVWSECRVCGRPDTDRPEHLAQALADAGLLARDLPSRNELASLIWTT